MNMCENMYENYILKLLSSHLPEYTVETVTLENLYKYENIFYDNIEYYMITDGHMAAKQDIIDTVKYSDDAISLGFCINSQSVAFLSLFLDYPESNNVYIGLFLMNNLFKKQGIGTKIIGAVQVIAFDLKYSSIQLSVQDNNTSGFCFWKKQGFYVIKKTQCDSFYNLSMKKTMTNKGI